MKLILTVSAIILMAGMLAGCRESGSSSGNAAKESSSGFISGSDSSESGPGIAVVNGDETGYDSEPMRIVHNPEPATLALFGAGIAAFALTRKRKK